MATVLGIDEAGRGPVIGPLSICGVLMEEEEIPRLVKEKVKDSKLLTFKQRGDLFGKIIKIAKKYKILLVEPEEIDHAVNGKDGLNLNWLEAEKAVELINAMNPDKVIMDCPSPNLKAFASYIRDRIKNKDIEIIAEHKADAKYPVVSAASICAKVMRDKKVSELEKKYGTIGSGYAHDPVTQKFLKENWAKHPEIFRHSWESYKRLHTIKDQKNLGEF